MLRRAALLVSLLAGLLLAACREPAPQALRLSAAPWQAGEVARYALFDGSAGAGSALLSVDAASVGGAPGWSLRRETAGPGGMESIQVELFASLRPAASALSLTDPAGTERVNATWNSGGQIDLELVSRLQNTTFERISVPTDTYDQRTLPLLARALPLAQGYATQINTFNSYTGRLERYTLRVRDRSSVSVPAGTFDAWEVELDNGERSVRYWIGTEGSRPVVQIQDANIRHALEVYEPGNTP